MVMMLSTLASIVPAFTVSAADATLPNSTINVQEGVAGNKANIYSAANKLTTKPLTFEATIKMTKANLQNNNLYAGVMIGAYKSEGEGNDTIMFDMAKGGPRVMISSYATGGPYLLVGARFDGALNNEAYYDKPVHIAITLDPSTLTTTLYINGEKQTDFDRIDLRVENCSPIILK